MDVDVVVIGSGAGGLAAAVALARAGKKVLVLEQHYLPGGWCHSFSLGGYRFSPGVHYLGELGEGGMLRRIYEGLGMGQDLAFCELNPDGYDHVVLGGGAAGGRHQRYDYVRGKERLADALSASFPAEQRGLRAYLDAVQAIGRELGALTSVSGLGDVAKLPLRAPTALRWMLSSARSLIEHHVSDPRLRAVLGAQAGDHGLPPSQAPAVLHAAVQAHYLEGGYYPRGGGAALPRAFIRALRRAGGSIRVKAPVSRILVEGRRAIGVRLADGTEVRARAVVSNADPQITLGRLVGHEHLSRVERLRLARARWSVSALSLFLATDLDLRALGLDSGNTWLFRDGDVDRTYAACLAGWSAADGPLPGGFVTATTLKDPSKDYGGVHTLEAFAFVGWDAFRAWTDTSSGSRPESYDANKRALLARMLEMVGQVVPGVEDHVVFAALGTPLTNEHYCAATHGNLYGTEKSLTHIGPFGQPLHTSIAGLWTCGASTLSHGVMGAHVSGLAVAARILRCRFTELLATGGAPVTLLSSEHPERWPRKPQRGGRAEGGAAGVAEAHA